MSSYRVMNVIRARNILLNFLGQIIPLIVGIASMPFVIRELGVEGFGILALAWMLLGYFTIFDLGLGRATTKFISEELGKGSTDEIVSVFWTSCWMNFFLGFIGGLIIAGAASFLAGSVFRISPGLVQTAEVTFYILAVSCPIVLVSSVFRGTLEAAQRFDYVNAVAVISSSLSFLLPVVGLLFGLNIYGIVILLMISRLGSALAYLFLCFRVFPVLREGFTLTIKRMRRLLNFGGWVSVSNLVNPILSYLDRFIIGSIISIAAVAYYTAPYEMVTRLSILPMSFAMTLFPSFSAVNPDIRETMASLYSRSVKFLLILMGPIVVVLIFFARDILSVWLGTQYAEISTIVLQILAIGIFFNSLAQVPYALIQGFGRPDITAKFHLFELLLYIPLTFFLVKSLGIAGGALSWTFRVTFDSFLLFIASGKFIDLRTFLNNKIKQSISIVVLLACIGVVLFFWELILFVRVIIIILTLISFVFVSWKLIFDTKDRELITNAVNHLVMKKKS